MDKIIQQLQALIVTENTSFGDFKTTPLGEPYAKELSDFIHDFYNLSIPSLGLNLELISSRKAVVSNYESKLEYDHHIIFADSITNTRYSLIVEHYAPNQTIRNIYISEYVEDVQVELNPFGAEAATLEHEKAQSLVDVIGSYFSVSGREVYVNTNSGLPNSEQLSELMWNATQGSTIELGGYTLAVQDYNEEITDESDAWSLGYGELLFVEEKQGFTVTLMSDLFLGQDTEIRGVTVTCGDAQFSISA